MTIDELVKGHTIQEALKPKLSKDKKVDTGEMKIRLVAGQSTEPKVTVIVERPRLEP